jgi:hypothetical protein
MKVPKNVTLRYCLVMELVPCQQIVVDNFEDVLTDLVVKPMNVVLKERGIGVKEFFYLIDSDQDLYRRYSIAMRYRAEFVADEVISIADTEVDNMRARVRVDARKWYASKLLPTKYGDRLALDVVHVDISGALSEARQRKEKLTHEINAPQAVRRCFDDTSRVTQLTETASAQRSHTPDLESVDTLDDILG